MERRRRDNDSTKPVPRRRELPFLSALGLKLSTRPTLRVLAKTEKCRVFRNSFALSSYHQRCIRTQGRRTAVCVSATAGDTARGEQPVVLERHAL